MVAVADDAGGDGLIYTSANSGNTWVPNPAPSARWDCVAASANGRMLAASGDAGVYTSVDFGTTWVWRTNLWFRSLASSADGTRLVAGGYGTYISSDSGATWTWATNGGYCVASSADGSKLAMAYFAYPGYVVGGIFASTNAGLAWRQTSAPLDTSTGWNSLTSSADGMKLAATIGFTDWPTGPGPIYASSDGGYTWEPTRSPVSPWHSIACSSDGIKLVATAGGAILTSTNLGAAWATNNVPSSIWSSVASSADGALLVAVVNGGGIWTSRATPAPLLSITPSDGNVVVCWTAPSLDFVLQVNSDSSTTNWTDVKNIPTLNFTNLQYQVVDPATNGSRFYRLKH
jgi:hypothetical protein